MGVKVTVDRVDALLKELNALTKQEVLVGIPAEGADRDKGDGKINNAQIGYIMEMGAPAANIPARPHLIPGVKAYRPTAIKRLKAAAEAAMQGVGQSAGGAPIDVRRVGRVSRSSSTDSAPAKEVAAQLNAIGLEAVSEVKKQITQGDLTPLKPATIAARKRAGFTGERPLIFTGDYIRHITYVIRKRNPNGR